MGKKRSKGTPASKTRAMVLPSPTPWAGWPADWGTSWGTGPLGERVAIVYACVERVASALASMPMQVSKDSMPQPEPVWIRNPEPLVYTHMGDAVTEIVWSLLLRGNAYIRATATGADGYPLRWAVLDPDKVSWESGSGDLGSWSVNGRLIPADGLLHIRHLNRPGYRLGMAPLDSAAMNLAAVADYERIASKLARNSGLPTQGILHTDQDLTETTAERYKKKWQERGDGEIAVMGSGLRYDPLVLNPRDLALLELREFDGRQIATVFGVPPFMINLAMAGDLTYSTTQGMMDFFWRQTLRPMAFNIGRALGTLLPGKSTVVFQADEYTRGTYSEHVTTLVQAAGGPIIDRNEARASIGLAPQSAPIAAPVPVDVTA